MPHTLLMPTRLITNAGSPAALGDAALSLGNHALVVTGRSALRASSVTDRIITGLSADPPHRPNP